VRSRTGCVEAPVGARSSGCCLHALLDGAAPAEVLVSDSASVLKAARAEFLADG
jgi:hypothetical protein